MRSIKNYVSGIACAGLVGILGSGCETASETNSAGTIAKVIGAYSSDPLIGTGYMLWGEALQNEAQLQGQREAAERVVQGTQEIVRRKDYSDEALEEERRQARINKIVAEKKRMMQRIIENAEVYVGKNAVDLNSDEIITQDEVIECDLKVYKSGSSFCGVVSSKEKCVPGRLEYKIFGPDGNLLAEEKNKEPANFLRKVITQGFDVEGTYVFAGYLDGKLIRAKIFEVQK